MILRGSMGRRQIREVYHILLHVLQREPNVCRILNAAMWRSWLYLRVLSRYTVLGELFMCIVSHLFESWSPPENSALVHDSDQELPFECLMPRPCPIQPAQSKPRS